MAEKIHFDISFTERSSGIGILPGTDNAGILKNPVMTGKCA
jgi:hypothetical protein